ncbi:MAG: hypothetical protein Q4B22_02985 [Eubacteriales bacterium]|nr:hypothetical protein [Eubacteriales bacterium]
MHEIEKELEQVQLLFETNAEEGQKLLEKVILHNKRRIRHEESSALQKIYKIQELKVIYNCWFNVEKKRGFVEFNRLRDTALELERTVWELMLEPCAMSPMDQNFSLAGDCFAACGDILCNQVEASILIEDQTQFMIWSEKVLHFPEHASTVICSYASMQILIWRITMIGNIAMLADAAEAKGYAEQYHMQPALLMQIVREGTNDEEVIANAQYSCDAAFYIIDSVFHPEKKAEISECRSRLSGQVRQYCDMRIAEEKAKQV